MHCNILKCECNIIKCDYYISTTVWIENFQSCIKTILHWTPHLKLMQMSFCHPPLSRVSWGDWLFTWLLQQHLATKSECRSFYCWLVQTGNMSDRSLVVQWIIYEWVEASSVVLTTIACLLQQSNLIVDGAAKSRALMAKGRKWNRNKGGLDLFWQHRFFVLFSLFLTYSVNVLKIEYPFAEVSLFLSKIFAFIWNWWNFTVFTRFLLSFAKFIFNLP